MADENIFELLFSNKWSSSFLSKVEKLKDKQVTLVRDIIMKMIAANWYLTNKGSCIFVLVKSPWFGGFVIISDKQKDHQQGINFWPILSYEMFIIHNYLVFINHNSSFYFLIFFYVTYLKYPCLVSLAYLCRGNLASCVVFEEWRKISIYH